MVASCDILLAASTATVGLPEINVGLLGGGRHGMRLFGHSRLRRMMLTGLRIDGDELYRLGIVEASVPPEALMGEAMALARELARSEEHTSELQSLMRISYAVFCFK